MKQSGKGNQHIIEIQPHTPIPKVNDQFQMATNFMLCFFKHKKYTICYGYKRKFRHSENNPSLSVPFSVLLARKEFGVYSLAGSTVVKIRI